MEKRYQVFVSSTFADLAVERSKVFNGLMKINCIPAGMEIFPATDAQQMVFIKRIIDDSDYYVLIIGGRYGSLTESGLSFTEEEYDYAYEQGKCILAFIHEDPGSIPANKTDQDSTLQAKLERFKDKKVSRGRLVDFWRTADELPGMVSVAVMQAINSHPTTGWVRASGTDNTELLSDLHRISKENDKLRSEITSNSFANTKRGVLKGLNDSTELYFNIHGINSLLTFYTSWGDIFYNIAPALTKPRVEQVIYEILNSVIRDRGEYPETRNEPRLNSGSLQRIRAHLLALGLISIKNSDEKGMMHHTFWVLTSKGVEEMAFAGAEYVEESGT